MTASDNLEFYGRVWGIPAVDREERIRELLTRMDLWDRRSDRVRDWSRGMQQKLALARALMHRPPLVFLDEPTAGLDVVGASALRTDLASLATREGVTIFMTTHNMAEAEQLCDLVAVIRHGRLVGSGKPDELRSGTGGTRVEIVGRGFGEDAVAAVRALPMVISCSIGDGRMELDLQENADTSVIVTALVGAGAQIQEVRRNRASLEEAFLAMMEEEE
jgi:ABC-2 type transport system ATP-binding protein